MCVCLSVCPAFMAYISLTICRILIKLGENVGTSVRLIVLKFHCATREKQARCEREYAAPDCATSDSYLLFMYLDIAFCPSTEFYQHILMIVSCCCFVKICWCMMMHSILISFNWNNFLYMSIFDANIRFCYFVFSKIMVINVSYHSQQNCTYQV